MPRHVAEEVEIPWRKERQVTLRELSAELQADSLSVRKYAETLKVKCFYVYTDETGRMPILAMSTHNANKIREAWAGRLLGKKLQQPTTERGWFYIMLTAPGSPSRLKLGFSLNPEERADRTRVFCPEAQILRLWPCRRGWEKTIIAFITARGCQQIADGIFECQSIDELLMRADALFAFAPDLTEKT